MKPYTKIEEVAEHKVPLFMSGLMGRDWQKCLKAIRETATLYHELNEFSIHQTAANGYNAPDDIKVIISAVFYAMEIQGTGYAA